MKSDKSSLEEVLERHLVPSVVISVANHESGQDEEKVHGQIAVVDNLKGGAFGISLKQMEHHDNHSRNSSQAVKNCVSLL